MINVEFFDIGDSINMGDYNGLVYLLRKFKRLNTSLTLGSLTLESDYGVFTFDKPLTSVGGNFIIEQEVNVSSSDCLRNCFYSFVFTVIDVNTSGTVNKRQVKVTGGTDEDGTLFITLPTDLIESDEVILPSFELDIVFDEHEYYTPVVGAVNVELETDKQYVSAGVTAIITATLTDRDGNLMDNVPVNFNVNGVKYATTTDEFGQAEYQYTGTGTNGDVKIKVITTSITIHDIASLNMTCNTDFIRFGKNLQSNGDVIIDWGDGTTTTINNPTSNINHTYTDGLSEHSINLIGDITGLGDSCFNGCSGLINIIIPGSVTTIGKHCFLHCMDLESVIITDGVVSIGELCFLECYALESVSIPSSVTNIGMDCLSDCLSLIDYQLYWKNSAILTYDSDKMANNTNTVFTIPYGQTSNYIAKNYPSAKLTERTSTKTDTILSISSSKSSYYTDESITITGALVDENDNPLTSTSVKIYQNNVLLDTLTTDSDGEFTKTLTGLNVGAYTFKAVYDGDSTYEASTSSNLNITVQNHTYSLSIASDKQSILTTESVTISGTLLIDSSPYASQSVALYDGATLVATLTTDSSGEYEETISNLSVGTHTFKAVHTNAESSTVSVTVTEPSHDYSLSVASTKDILSYADSESATLTATLKDNNVAVAGETLSYTIKHGSTTITTGSDTTDSSGQITFNYSATGIGDVTVEVDYSTLLQETYELLDCYCYDGGVTGNKSTAWTASSNISNFYNIIKWRF